MDRYIPCSQGLILAYLHAPARLVGTTGAGIFYSHKGSLPNGLSCPSNDPRSVDGYRIFTKAVWSWPGTPAVVFSNWLLRNSQPLSFGTR